MTSHFIDRFARRADHVRSLGERQALRPAAAASEDSSSAPAAAPLRGAGTGDVATPAATARDNVERRELAGEQDDDCTFCAIVARQEPARKVPCPSLALRRPPATADAADTGAGLRGRPLHRILW